MARPQRIHVSVESTLPIVAVLGMFSEHSTEISERWNLVESSYVIEKNGKDDTVLVRSWISLISS